MKNSLKVAVIGSTRGIGLALIKKLQAEGHEVFAFCREPSEELKKANPKQIVEGFDVELCSTLDTKISDCGLPIFDWVFHVAGYMVDDTLDSLNEEMLLKHFRINCLGPLFTIKYLKEHLAEGSKVGIISSRKGSIEDNLSGDSYGFRMSKAALNMAIKNLSFDLGKAGVQVYSLHPGYVKTQITGFQGEILPDEAAQGLYSLMSSLGDESIGRFWHANGSELPW